jgi:excisionase family DNA binding protein
MAARKETFELTTDELYEVAEIAASKVGGDRLDDVEETLQRVLDCLDASAEWLTVQTAADRASVSTKTVRRWMDRSDSLPYTRVDGVVRIRRQDLDAWLERHKA